MFIFLRWSPHFASFYTTQFLPNTTTSANANFFPILHLLPVDIGTTSSFADVVLNYGQNILSTTINDSFNDDVSVFESDRFLFSSLKVIFTLNELESVEYLRQTYSLPFLSPVTLNSDRKRQFNYLLIGRQCNYTWTVFKKMYSANSTLENVDTELNLCTHITYPNSDALTSDNSGWFDLNLSKSR